MENLNNKAILKNFEALVDELIKEKVNEPQIKFLMEKLSFDYEPDPVQRLGFIFEKMNLLRINTNDIQKVKHDLLEHS